MNSPNSPLSSGYSGTPLAKKLGIKESHRLYVMDPPSHYLSLLAPLPSLVEFVTQPDVQVDLVHVFVTQKEVLAPLLAAFRGTLKPDAVIWVSWPKKASKVPSTVTEDTIREFALPVGFVDIKVCAVDEVWSGLKLVLRKELR
ncbi:DUF3052 domain-containing protein [Undibacterium sp. RuTC16W]|uniref:DUF3052 domain-containing protein n=1 Tax=Undibacterium sp. RuTC16W TaxID=3413048 RepID=UPI003BF26D7E